MKNSQKQILKIAALVLKESRMAAQARALRQEVCRINAVNMGYYCAHSLNTDPNGKLEITVALPLYLELFPSEAPQVSPISRIDPTTAEDLPPTHARLAYPALPIGELEGRPIMIRAWSAKFELPAAATQPQSAAV